MGLALVTDEEMIKRIEKILEHLRPTIKMDGGDISFVRYANGIVYVKLHGACADCLFSTYTLKMGVEKALQEAIDGIREVKTVNFGGDIH
jgi:Fe-S cluster biogenesis protein NfuA